jgi:hypothetical protein
MADVLGGVAGGAIVGGIAGGVAGGLGVMVVALLMPRRNCPECGFAFPKLGRKYARPGFQGGWICPKCKCEVDRRGNKVT